MNPLLIVLAECRHLQDEPETALVKLMMALNLHMGPESIFQAADWEEDHGEPTYPNMEAWARAYAADPANACHMETLVRQHHESMASFSPEELADMTPYLKSEWPMKRKLNPLSDHVIVRREEAEDKTPGGLLLPDVAKKKPVRGEVLAVGPGRTNDDGREIPVNLARGEVVLFDRYAAVEVELDGETYLILSESDILAILKE